MTYSLNTENTLKKTVKKILKKILKTPKNLDFDIFFFIFATSIALLRKKFKSKIPVSKN